MSISLSKSSAAPGDTITITYDANIVPVAPNGITLSSHIYYINYSGAASGTAKSQALSTIDTERAMGTCNFVIPQGINGDISFGDFACGYYPPTNMDYTYIGNTVSLSVDSATPPTPPPGPSNLPPSAPGGVTASQRGRRTSPHSTWDFSWTASSDADGDNLVYYPQYSSNGSTWYDVGTTANLSSSVNITSTLVYFRVRAWDGTAYSDYRTSSAYTPIFNRAPSLPGAITIPSTAMSGASIAIRWGAATDPDGDTTYYKAEVSTNGGSSFNQIYQGTSNSTYYTIPGGFASVVIRVKAYDSYGAESGYVMSQTCTIITNAPPKVPSAIHVSGTLAAGCNAAITWAQTSDPDNNLSGYLLERSTNNGTFTEIHRSTALSYNDTIGDNWTTVAYRVKAYDTYNAQSGYRTSNTYQIDSSKPPIISCDLSGDIGEKNADFTITYSVTDPDNDTVTVSESLDNIVKRTFTATLAQANTFDLSSEYFMKILNGSHTLTITATDSRGKSAAYALSFTKAVHALRITLASPLPSATLVNKMVMNVAKSLPTDAIFSVKVTNNPSDAIPIWEDVTAKITHGLNHVFANTTITGEKGFNFIITASRGISGMGGYITSAGGAFE